MKRLNELNGQELLRWAQERFRVGQLKYGKAHLQRHTLVDVMEELLDADNVLSLTTLKIAVRKHEPVKAEVENRLDVLNAIADIQTEIRRVMDKVQQLDKMLPEEFDRDEKGGKRIWWNQEAGHGQEN